MFNRIVKTIPLKSNSVSKAVINLATTDGCDVVMIGASREGLLQHTINGNIPEAIARGVIAEGRRWKHTKSMVWAIKNGLTALAIAIIARLF